MSKKIILIVDSENGYVVIVGDEKALADRVMYLAMHEEIRKRFAMNCREYYEKRFTEEVMIQGYMRYVFGISASKMETDI